MNKHRIGALVAAAALTLTFAGTSLAATYATVTGHTAFSSDANGADFWGEDCSKVEWNGEDETYVLDQDYALVVVKSGSGEFANTEFANASAGETVWADVNGNGEYDDDDKGISHIIFCDADETTTTTSDETTTTSSDTTTTTSSETTTTTTSSETTTTTTQPTGSLFAFPTASFECGGSITVTNFAAANVDDVLITGPGDDVVISEDGTYELVPGDYIGVGRVDGVAVTDEVPFTIEECTTTTTTTSSETTTTSSEETTPEGSVEELTPPSTDTIGQPTSSSSVSTGLLLVLAGILAAVLVVVPAAARNRR